MKKIIPLALTLSFLVSIPAVWADTDVELTNEPVTNENVANTNTVAEEQEDPGTLPDSKFYWLKTWRENIQLFFTFNDVKKAEKQMKFANRRMLELEKLCEKDKCELAQKLASRFEEKIRKTTEKLEEANEKGKDVQSLIEKLEANQERHQEVLLKVYDQVPEEAKEAILQAMENSQKGIENAIANIQKDPSQLKEFKEKIDKKVEEVLNEEEIDKGKAKVNSIREKLQEKGLFNVKVETTVELDRSNAPNTGQ